MAGGDRAPNAGLGGLGDAYFDEEGRLYIANKALAREIQLRMNADGRIRMVRDRFPEEPLAVARSASGEPRRAMAADMSGATDPTGTGTADLTVSGTTDPTPPGTGTEESDPKANMMCPCSPDPIP
jgi:hypothetical protein